MNPTEPFAAPTAHSGDIELPGQNDPPTEWGSELLPVVFAIAAICSVAVCIFVANIVIGNAGPFEVAFGLSSPNLALALLAAGFVFMPTAGVSAITYLTFSERRRWVSLIPAALLPLAGGGIFFVFLATGLG